MFQVTYNDVKDAVPHEVNLALEEKHSHLAELDTLATKLKSRNAEIEVG